MSLFSKNRETPQKNGKDPGGQNIQVYVRVRPLSSGEKDLRATAVVSATTQREVSVSEPRSNTKKTFSFDRVFDDFSRQEDVFRSVAAPLIKQGGNSPNPSKL